MENNISCLNDKESSRKSNNFIEDADFRNYIEAVTLAILNCETTIEAEHDMLVQNCSMYNVDYVQIEDVMIELKGAFADAISCRSPYSRKYVHILCKQWCVSDEFAVIVDNIISQAFAGSMQTDRKDAKNQNKYSTMSSFTSGLNYSDSIFDAMPGGKNLKK